MSRSHSRRNSQLGVNDENLNEGNRGLGSAAAAAKPNNSGCNISSGQLASPSIVPPALNPPTPSHRNTGGSKNANVSAAGVVTESAKATQTHSRHNSFENAGFSAGPGGVSVETVVSLGGAGAGQPDVTGGGMGMTHSFNDLDLAVDFQFDDQALGNLDDF
jgi:hypothetical protein